MKANLAFGKITKNKMKEFYLEPDLHSATMVRLIQRGADAEKRYRSLFENESRDSHRASYRMSLSDIEWVLGILEQELREHPHTEHTGTSIDILVTTWQRILHKS